MSRDSGDGCKCPYCQGPVEKENDICAPCSVKIRYCVVCGRPLPKGAAECPHCASEQGHRVEGKRR